MKRLSLAFVVGLLFLLWLVARPALFGTESTHGKGMTHTFNFGDNEARLQQGIARIQAFEEELRAEGFRQLSESVASSATYEKRKVTLEGRYRHLGTVEVTLWTNTGLNTEEPQIGAGFDADIRNDASELAWEELSARFRRAVQGDD